MFRKTDQDKIHHVNIKRGITSHFARMLKILQQKHVQQSEGDEFVYSNDESNNLCNALEGVFLHGLKPPVKQKLSSYVGLAAPQDASVNLNFWGVAQKFTHKDVITQLKSLSQVTTETGLCRVWIRLALNDGLMESYLHSIVVDVKSLKYFYHSYSYLRDIEQPGILKNYLTGLMSLAFKLSLNSSVLNDWNNSTLQLISNLHGAPPPTIRQVDSAAQDYSQARVLRRDSKDRRQRPREDCEPIVASRSSSSASIHDRRDGQAIFNSIQDVEAIRRMTPAPSESQVSYTPSNGSSSSRTSCPDPSGRLLSVSPIFDKMATKEVIVSPHLYPRPDQLPDADNAKRLSLDSGNLPVISSPPSTAVIDDAEEDLDTYLALSPPRPRSRRVIDEDSQIVSSLGSVSSLPQPAFSAENDSSFGNLLQHDKTQALRSGRSPSPMRFKASPSSQKQYTLVHADDKTDGPSSSTIPNPVTDDQEEIYDDIYSAPTEGSPSPAPSEEGKAKERSFNAICAGLPEVKLDPSVQDAILKKVLGEIDRQADKEREARDLRDSSKAGSAQDTSKTYQEKVSSASPKFNSPLPSEAKGRPVSQPKTGPLPQAVPETHSISDLSFEKSTDTITGDDRMSSADEDPILSPDQKVHEEKSSSHEAIKRGTINGEDNEEEYGSGRFGNNLSSMMGWSSEIDPKQKETMKESKEDKNRSESFASMLRSYMPSSLAEQPVVTLDQVIESLPCESLDGEEEEDDKREDEEDGAQSRHKNSSAKDGNTDLMQHQDSCLEDFEVLQSPVDSLCGQVEANSSRMIFLFRVPQEHGLSHQNFTCRGCCRPIGIIYGQPRLCSFDGGLYCYKCHENMESYIPSSIVYDWDFRKKKVCTENHKFLQELESQALYDIQELNPKLYSHLPELKDLKILRQRLCNLKSYLFTCSQKMAEALRQKVWPREHLYDRRDLYSISDLLQVQSGSLQRLIKDLVKFSSQHVYSCVLCSQKGYVCEICRSSRIIYPFEVDTTIRCDTCKAVYHKTCMTEGLPCPKCERWGRRTNSSIDQNHPEDYGMSPVQGSGFSRQFSPSSVSP